ncbi:MAG: Gldg family protein [Oceanicaulis sp.]
MNGARFLLVMAASLLVGFAGLNLFSGAALDGLRLDLTERGLYQLSPGTREVLARIDEPVELTFYYSRTEAARYPAIRAYGARVREMLRTIAARSGGRVRLEEIDPDPFSAEEDAAIAAGLEPAPTEDGGQIFFGLTGRNAVDDQRLIPFFDPVEEARLEYEIVRTLAELERARVPKIAVISDLPFAPDRDGNSANRIIDELAAAFQVEWLENDFEALPEDADALFILHPAPLEEAQSYLIDQFALTTGRVLALVDPMAHVALKAGPDGLPPVNANRASTLDRLFSAWGVAYDVNTTAMDARNGLPVQIVEGGRTRMRAYPLWFTVTPAQMNEALPAVAALSRGVNLGSPGVLAPLPGLEDRFTPVLTTSQAAARLDADRAASSPAPEELMRQLDPAPDAPLTLAARLSGPFQTAFPEGPPAADIDLDPGAHVEVSQSESEIVVIADADLLDPAFYLRSDPAAGEQVVADNPALILNLADRLAGDPALVSLRSRAGSDRPMVRVEALRADAEARYLALQDELQAELSDAEARLEALTREGRASALGGAGEADSAEAETLRAQIVDARERLREIERGFRVEIDALERGLMIWTVWFPPLLVIACAILFTLIRRRRRPA